MRPLRTVWLSILVCAASPSLTGRAQPAPALGPGVRVLLDAHNAYPYEGKYVDRVPRALGTGTPLAIEQDVAWCPGPSGAYDAVVTHDATCRGGEPTLESYFFASVAPVLDAALAAGRREDWPVITLNLDFKMDTPELHRAVWALLGRHQAWLTTALRAPGDLAQPLTAGPLLVLTGEADSQESDFYATVPPGDRLRLFGAVHNLASGTGTPDDLPRPAPATNYRRWWNHPWKVVEKDGQRAAGSWTADEEARLNHLVHAAHAAGLWIRFYTLDGTSDADADANGWFGSYNFGSLDAVQTRWRAAIRAGVDFIATDQYEAFAQRVAETRGKVR